MPNPEKTPSEIQESKKNLLPKEIRKEEAKKILLSHPEWQISAFSLSGSTRNRICIDVISSNPQFKSHFFDIENMHISILAASEEVLKHIPQIKERYEILNS